METRDLVLVPDSLPEGMGVCVVRYSGWSGQPYSDFGRAHPWVVLAPIPPISETDSIYGGVYQFQQGDPGDAWMYGYPGEYRVPFMFPLKYVPELPRTESETLSIFALVDTLDICIMPGCTTYVNASMPWRPKSLLVTNPIQGTFPLDRNGKVRVLLNNATDSTSIFLSKVNAYQSMYFWESTNNHISLPEGIHRLEIMHPNNGSILVDSVIVTEDSVTVLAFDFPFEVIPPANLHLESLMSYPDEWINPGWDRIHIAEISPFDDECKNSDLLGYYARVDENEENEWNLISIYNRHIIVYSNIGLTNRISFPEHFISNTHTISANGRIVLLNAISMDNLVPEIAIVDLQRNSVNFSPYSNIRWSTVYGQAVNLRRGGNNGLIAMNDGSCIMPRYNRITCYTKYFSEVLWEIDSLQSTKYYLDMLHAYSESRREMIITKSGYRIDDPIIELEFHGRVHDSFSLPFSLLSLSDNLDSLIFRHYETDSIYLASRPEFSHTLSEIIPICEVRNNSDLVLLNNDRILIGDGDSYRIYPYGQDTINVDSYELPIPNNEWYYDRFIHLDDGLIVVRASKGILIRHLAFSEYDLEPIWLSPIRVRKGLLHNNQDQITEEMGKAGFFSWYDGFIHIVEFRKNER